MNILAADDERMALESLVAAIEEAAPDAAVQGFRKSREALEYAQENHCDVAFLDIEMRGMNGLELAKNLKELQPDINVVFVTGYSQYMGEAFEQHVSGYVLKPVDAERVKKELVNLRYPVEEKEKQHRIQAQTFGNFEVFGDGTPLKFRYSRTKEILAYLIDRCGAAVNTQEICAVLWEDAPVTMSMKSQVRNCITDLKRTLAEYGSEEIVIRRGRNLAVDVDRFDCDLYNFLRMDVSAINSYRGEYMTQYSWAEMTLGSLNSMKE